MKKHFLLTTLISFLPIISFSQTIEWQNTIGGSEYEIFQTIAQTTDGGYILGGYSNSNISGDKTENCIGYNDYWIVKTDSIGVIQWQNSIGGSSVDGLSSIAQTSDGGYILGGYSYSYISGDKTEDRIGNGCDYWIVKIDPAGAIQWQNTIGGSEYEVIYSIAQTTDGGYILGGSSNSNISVDKTENCIGYNDYWIVKTDSNGVVQWQNTIGGSSDDYLLSIAQTTDGGYILGGYSESNISGDKTENSNGGDDYWIVKTDSSGAIQWQNTIGGSLYEELHSIAQTSDGGYILGGWSDSNISGDKTENSNGSKDYWIVKTDSTGVIQWQNTIGGSDLDELNSVIQTSDGGYILGGFSYSNISGDKTEDSNAGDYWIVKIDGTGAIQWQNTIGGSDMDLLLSIAQSSDGGYILGGHSTSNISGDKTENSNGGTDYWIVKIQENPTSLDEFLNKTDVLYPYPNPANTTLNIETRMLPVSGSKLIISDVAGRTLLTKTLDANSNKHQIEIASFSSGIYFVIVEAGDDISRGRFVKE